MKLTLEGPLPETSRFVVRRGYTGRSVTKLGAVMRALATLKAHEPNGFTEKALEILHELRGVEDITKSVLDLPNHHYYATIHA